jgi:hypothetical protein
MATEKAGQRCLALAGFRSFGEPFGSPIPQRPQPLDISLRVEEIIRRFPAPAYSFIVSLRRRSLGKKSDAPRRRKGT